MFQDSELKLYVYWALPFFGVILSISDSELKPVLYRPVDVDGVILSISDSELKQKQLRYDNQHV